MTAENWLQRASGLVVPAVGFADHPLGRWQPCVGPCCESDVTPCEYCSTGNISRYAEVTIAGVTDGTCSGCSVLNATHVVGPVGEGAFACAWRAANYDFTCPGSDWAVIEVSAGVAWDITEGKYEVAAVIWIAAEGEVLQWAGYHLFYDDKPDCTSFSDLVLTQYYSTVERCNLPNTVTLTSI